MKRIMILSGAGLSEESGINTFRDENGLWEEHNLMDVCSTEGWIKNRKLVTQFYNERRSELASKKPNHAHIVLADLEKRYRGRIIHLTQNVDDLLERAGCQDTIHLHGKLTELRCEACTKTFDIGYIAQDENSSCPHCGNQRVRHNVVMFGENAPRYTDLQQATRLCSLLIVIGTSGNVIDITKLTREFKHSVLVNPKRHTTKSQYDPYEYIDEYFERYIQKKATDAIDEVASIVEEYLL